MRSLEFTKMQGLGNDFVVVEGPVELGKTEIVELCDRRLGVGADGLLVVDRGDSIRMQYWNADGSPAEMCGNGLRCVARYAYDKAWSSDRNFGIQTPVGLRGARVLDDGVEVDLGRPTIGETLVLMDEEYISVDVGNPHAVRLVADPAVIDVGVIGEAIQSSFPRGANIEFARLTDQAVDMRVWERGVGETLACGSGIVAVAKVASVRRGLEGPIVVNTPGGQATVEFRGDVAWLQGPAEYVFRGTVGER